MNTLPLKRAAIGLTAAWLAVTALSPFLNSVGHIGSPTGGSPFSYDKLLMPLLLAVLAGIAAVLVHRGYRRASAAALVLPGVGCVLGFFPILSAVLLGVLMR